MSDDPEPRLLTPGEALVNDIINASPEMLDTVLEILSESMRKRARKSVPPPPLRSPALWPFGIDLPGIFND